MKKKNKINNVYGTWKVTTSGSGVTVVDLGIHTGYVDEIALSLANKCINVLIFKKLDTEEKYTPVTDKVNVMFYGDDNLGHIKYRYDRMSEIRKMFKDRPVEIEKGEHEKTFTIIASEDTKMEVIKNKALAKLTEEEKKALGIK